MIQCSVMWHDIEKNSFTFTQDSHLHGTHKCIELWIHLKTLKFNEIQSEIKFIQKLNLVFLITFDVLDGFL